MQFLLQPYPFYYKGRALWKLAGILFVMTLLFSYLFQPFVVYTPEHKMDYFWISVIHACTPVLIIALFSLLSISARREEKWNVGKEILLVLIFLFLVGIVQFLIRDLIYDNPNNWSLRYLFEEIRNTLFVGSLFVVILVSLNYNRLNSRNSRNARTVHLSADRSVRDNGITVYIETEVKSDDFILKLDDFIFARADGNYVEFFLKNGNGSKQVKRIGIKDLESSLATFPNIMRTHRSYLVNLQHVSNVTGNAQGYKIILHNYEGVIPVSRQMIKGFDANMKRI